MLPSYLTNDDPFHLAIHNEQEHFSNFIHTSAHPQTKQFNRLVSPGTHNAESSHIEQSSRIGISGMCVAIRSLSASLFSPSEVFRVIDRS